MVTLPAATHLLASDLTTGDKGQRAAGRLGDSLGSRLARASRLPIDPTELAKHEGIDVAQVLSLPEAGRIEWVGDELRILVRKTDSSQRQRFTVAHELAHHLIFGVEKVARRAYSTEEEARCDRFAAGLLMPRKSFKDARSALRSVALPEAILSLQEQFDVSLRSAMRRLDELKLIDGHLLLLLFHREDRGEYRVVGAVYDRRAYWRIEGMTARSLGMSEVIGSLISMPQGSRRLRASAQLPARIRGQAAGSPSTVHGDVTCAPLGGEWGAAPDWILIDIDPVAPPLGGRLQRRSRPLQAEFLTKGHRPRQFG
ncbi:MAG: ImmA/IrrE family metallo-endopeptidase [Chloroflexi bacterium]|nr:ImmA/IrrE family metallo-endopeptidase [Chloroflexota bacterium]